MKTKYNKRNYTHGESSTRLYKIWIGIKKRCFNQNCWNYKYYGGRGITICNGWLDFIPFRDWALNNGYQEDLIIDRKNSNIDYNPENCRWITVLESNRNKRNTINIQKANEIRELYKTGDYTQKQIAKKFNISFGHVSDIINKERWG